MKRLTTTLILVALALLPAIAKTRLNNNGQKMVDKITRLIIGREDGLVEQSTWQFTYNTDKQLVALAYKYANINGHSEWASYEKCPCGKLKTSNDGLDEVFRARWDDDNRLVLLGVPDAGDNGGEYVVYYLIYDNDRLKYIDGYYPNSGPYAWDRHALEYGPDGEVYYKGDCNPKSPNPVYAGVASGKPWNSYEHSDYIMDDTNVNIFQFIATFSRCSIIRINDPIMGVLIATEWGGSWGEAIPRHMDGYTISVVRDCNWNITEVVLVGRTNYVCTFRFDYLQD